MPGIGEEIDGAVQQAPQSGRQLNKLVIRQFVQQINEWNGMEGAILPG
jgi:hypothetical protein